MAETKVSIVIPTLNCAQILEKCLININNSINKYKPEIIIIDGGSTDRTVEIAEKYGAKVYIESTFFPGINRNKGVKKAEGEIICFVDSDCLVPENWLDEVVDGLLRLNAKDNRIVGVGVGNIPLLERHTFIESAIAIAMRSPLVSFKARNMAVYKNEREVTHNPTIGSAYFKWAFEEVGGFNSEHGYGYGEDTELDAKLIRKGYKLYYIPNILVYHRHRSDFTGFIKQMYDYGKARILVGRKYKEYLRFYHFGPIFLCLMTIPPFIVVPLGMGLVNGAFTSFKQRDYRLLFPVALLTMSFYVSYGLGEIAALLRRTD